MTSTMLGCAAGLLAALIVSPLVRRSRSTRPYVRSSASMPLRQPRQDYAVLLDAVARRVRSGSSLTSALVDEIDRGTPLGLALDRLTEGGALVTALATVIPGDADLALTVQALAAAAHLGGPVAATLDEAASVLRERSAARAERRAHASQARLSARVLTVVPLIFALWSAAASQRTRDVYLSSIVGGTSALCGLALNVAGWQWMKRIIGPT